MNSLARPESITKNSPFLEALNLRVPSRVPVWFMRQAGRSLPEYRAIRGTGSILDAVKDPELAAEITMQPVRRYDVDAAILYSDIIVPVHAAGFGIDIVPGRGPVTDNPFRQMRDLERISNFSAPDNCRYVAQAIEIASAKLDVPLIGFAGAPFTVASYLIEGGPSRSFIKTKQMMHNEPLLFGALLDRLAQITIDFLVMQIKSGVNAIQIFDSWIGALSPREYRKFILVHMKAIFSELTKFGVPMIHFGVNTSDLLELLAQSGASAVGLDFRSEITTASKRLGPNVALQGNLDPIVALCDIDVIKEQARATLVDSAPAPGYIFNLGHGVLPETEPDKLAELVEFVHLQGNAIRGQSTTES